MRRKPATRDLRFCPCVSVRATTVDEAARTVEATLSTENPVPMFDWSRYEYVDEILLSDGMTAPKSKQVPLLNSHNRSSMVHQLGSVRNVRTWMTETRGTLAFSSVHDDEFRKVIEGHSTDVSVGYTVLQREYVAEGKTKRIRGREFHGPVNLALQWRLYEVSLTPIGADEDAKLRGLDPATVRLAIERKHRQPADNAALAECLRLLAKMREREQQLLAAVVVTAVDAAEQRENAGLLRHELNRLRAGG